MIPVRLHVITDHITNNEKNDAREPLMVIVSKLSKQFELYLCFVIEFTLHSVLPFTCTYGSKKKNQTTPGNVNTKTIRTELIVVVAKQVNMERRALRQVPGPRPVRLLSLHANASIVAARNKGESWR